MAQVQLNVYVREGFKSHVEETWFTHSTLAKAIEAAAIAGYQRVKVVGSDGFLIIEPKGLPLTQYWSHSPGQRIPDNEEIKSICARKWSDQ